MKKQYNPKNSFSWFLARGTTLLPINVTFFLSLECYQIYHHTGKAGRVNYPSISARSWFIVCLEYGCIGDSIRFPPTESNSSINITQGAFAFASPRKTEKIQISLMKSTLSEQNHIILKTYKIVKTYSLGRKYTDTKRFYVFFNWLKNSLRRKV